MFMRTLLHGLLASAAAVLTIGAISGPVASADPAPTDAPCRLAANVAFSLDPVGRTFGSGNVTCAGPVYQITVQVTLTQDSRIIGTDRNLCQGVATCDATVATLNPTGTQTWCATASGAYQLTPSGPVFDLGTKRLCRQG